MSEPCEHEQEGAWIWQQQINLVKGERDAAVIERDNALDRVARVVDIIRAWERSAPEEGWGALASQIYEAIHGPHS